MHDSNFRQNMQFSACRLLALRLFPVAKWILKTVSMHTAKGKENNLVGLQPQTTPVSQNSRLAKHYFFLAIMVNVTVTCMLTK